MYYPDKKDFLKLAKKGNLIPICRNIMADIETPVSAFAKIEGRYSFLLESVEGGQNVGRYSFLGCEPYMLFQSKNDEIRITAFDKKKRTEVLKGDPFEVLKKLMKEHRPMKVEGLPRFHGGAVGYIAYDAVRFIENIPDKNPDDLGLADIQLLFTDTIIAFDHVKHMINVISNARIKNDPSASYDLAVKKIEEIIRRLKAPVKLKQLELPDEPPEFRLSSNFTKIEFEQNVVKAKEYIKAGDIIQVVPSQRFTAPLKREPLTVYRILRAINPSPYMYYLKFDDVKLIGSSPEVMVRLEGTKSTVRPIAGTRKRGSGEEEDLALERELLSDEKEKAEHIMLVDLARNDLGKVCEKGSVKATRLMDVEKYSHVMHIVSNVEGTLEKGKDAFDLFKAAFPAGTVSGAPKIRAMEIIDELENTKRGPYAGAVGYFDFYGDLDTCITIRTILVKNKTAYVQAGGGIVLDSSPSKEYEESCNKARALIRALK
ncbi:MAG: anthranilate synthase component I [Candidatus Margulisiibacteriota bacterium]